MNSSGNGCAGIFFGLIFTALIAFALRAGWLLAGRFFGG